MTVLELNYWVALGTLILQVASVFLLILYFVRIPGFDWVRIFLGKQGILIGLLFSLAGIVMSLVYSEYFGIVPCGLCWFSRIFLYPQAILFGLALLKRDMRIADYSIGLSILGALTSLYHHYLQMGGGSVLPCPAAGAVDCAKRFIFEFGYITFPLVAFSGFVFLIVLMLYVRARHEASKKADMVS